MVVEAGARSGSLNTAGHAAALGRPLGAVPGPVTSSSSAGCHRLLREFDAVCVTSAEQIAELAPLDALARSDEMLDASADRAPDGAPHPPAARADPAGIRVRLLDALAPRSARNVESLAALSGLAVDRVRSELGLLALEGLAAERAGGWVRGAAADRAG